LWGELQLSGNGAPPYRSYLDTGYTGSAYYVGGAIPLQHGLMVGPTQQGLGARLGRSACQGNCEVDWSLVPQDSRVVLVPLVDFVNPSGPGTLMGFVTGWIVSTDGGPVNFQIISGVTGNGRPGGTGPETGTFVPILMN
jgi:hypothetical protein